MGGEAGTIRFECVRVYGKGYTKRWACRAFVANPKCIKGEMWVGRYDPEASRHCHDIMGVWDTYTFGCTDVHAIENFKREFAPEIRDEQDKARSFNWPKNPPTTTPDPNPKDREQ